MMRRSKAPSIALSICLEQCGEHVLRNVTVLTEQPQRLNLYRCVAYRATRVGVAQ